MAEFKQYKISNMIEALQSVKEEHGDLLIEMSIDEEGNAFHPLGDYVTETKGKKEVLSPFEIGSEMLTIYPC